jgi:hypothetical protein
MPAAATGARNTACCGSPTRERKAWRNTVLERMKMHAIVGKWEKTSTDRCSGPYPETVEFLVNGVYSGDGIPKETTRGWKHGVWEIINERQIALSVGDEKVLRYGFVIKSDTLSFISPDGCVFLYRRSVSTQYT